MARAPLTEFRAKHILTKGSYSGMHVTKVIPKLQAQHLYAVKVDQGVKQRMKKGLMKINAKPSDVTKAIHSWRALGYTSFLIEKMQKHASSAERYISAERVRTGIRISFSRRGGIDVEEAKEEVLHTVMCATSDIEKVAQQFTVPRSLIETLYACINEGSISFIEINPCVIDSETWIPLDALMLVDTVVDSKLWRADDIASRLITHKEEVRIGEIQETTAASLKLKVMNRDGAFFFLLSGGGGSLVVMDAVAEHGNAHMIGNYGEYSGNPTKEETFLYTREILSLLIASNAKRKVLVIAGGIANFTNIAETFAGLIQALNAVAPQLRQQKVRVIVRRGGPQESEGLRLMRTFLRDNQLMGSVYGSETSLVHSINEACDSISKP